MSARDLVRLGLLTARGGCDDQQGWPSAPRLRYEGCDSGRGPVRHPHDDGVWLGGYDAAFGDEFDAVVSLCRMGAEPLGAEHIEFWLVDDGWAANPNLSFVLNDAARTIRDLRARGRTVLVHGVEGRSRTPSVAARYSRHLGRDPRDVLAAMPWADPNPRLWSVASGLDQR